MLRGRAHRSMRRDGWRGDRGGRDVVESEDAARNRRIVHARRAEEIHQIVASEPLSMVNAATAVTRLARLGTTNIGNETPWAKLRDAVAAACGAFGAREVANVLHGYGKLSKCGLGTSLVPLDALAAVAEREAPSGAATRVL